MAYDTEKNGQDTDIVINGFEEGIAPSPYDGIADIRNADIISVPHEAPVAFKTSALTLPPAQSAVAFSAVAATNVLTVTSTTGYYNGMAVYIDSYTSTGLAAGDVYFVGSISGNTFKLYTNLSLSTEVDVTGDGTGTLTTTQMGEIVFSAAYPSSPFQFLIDENGRVWNVNMIALSLPGGTLPVNAVSWLGNTTLTNANGDGIVAFKGYLLVFRQSAIDYLPLSNIQSGVTKTSWVYGWQTPSSSAFLHHAISAQDDAVYFCNNSFVGSILENAGSTFNPSSSSTYTYNAEALAIPLGDATTYLAELGTDLLVGGLRNFVYPWDRVSTSYNYPLVLGESRTYRIVSTNSNAYIFAGDRGRIYITNGSNVEEFFKIPDHISGTISPYFMIGTPEAGTHNGDAIYWRNQIYFSFSCEKNDGTAIETVAGIWAIDITTKAFRLVHKPSYSGYAGKFTNLFTFLRPRPDGDGVYGCWSNSGAGIDAPSTSPYTSYETYIDTDYIPVGTYLNPTTDKNIEFKLATPLVSGETLRMYYRQKLSDSFTLLTNGSSSNGVFSTAGILSGFTTVNFQKSQWLQIRVEYSSTASSPSYTRLREIRIR
jgi:hypothetical protein